MNNNSFMRLLESERIKEKLEILNMICGAGKFHHDFKIKESIYSVKCFFFYP